MKYKIGIDLGSTSLGWAVVKLDDNNNPSDLLDMGVRIFPDGRDVKSHEPLCVGRRIARGSRNRHDRILIRKKNHNEARLEKLQWCLSPLCKSLLSF